MAESTITLPRPLKPHPRHPSSGLRDVISLEGASVEAVDDPGSPGPYKDYDPSLPPFRFEMSLPARRLSLLTPGETV